MFMSEDGCLSLCDGHHGGVHGVPRLSPYDCCEKHHDQYAVVKNGKDFFFN